MAVITAPPPPAAPAAPAEPPAATPWRVAHPILNLVARRGLAGIVTLFVVSIVIFVATQTLPGNAAYSVLGRSATPARLHALEQQLHLNRSAIDQYWVWLSGLLTGRLGNSLANGLPVWGQIEPRLVDSSALVFIAGFIGTVLGILFGATAALRKDGWFDHLSSVVALAVTSLPEFVVGIGLVILFSTDVFHLLPAVSFLPAGTYFWNSPKLLILPIATLIIVIIPYIYRMMRAAMVEALESEYVEMARLKGVGARRLVIKHALPNAIAPTIQVVGLNFLYLAGGIVIVEVVFGYPGIGQGLYFAVQNRDIPEIQLIVLILAAFYVFMNILSDVIALLATPRRRIAR
ncbi:MAG: ABC transporter permease [Acidimicrobiales bacterium]|jgi:peptide/nickel transport system permease protein